MLRRCHEVFSRAFQKKEATTGRPVQKSVSEPLRFTSNVAEFTDATWTTGCRRNASSWKSTPRATMGVRERNDLLISTTVLANSNDEVWGKQHVEDQFQ